MLRLAPLQHLALKQAAEAHSISLNEWIVQKLFSAKEPVSLVVSTILAAFHKDVKGIVLFGSVARGQDTRSSDVDLLIVLTETRQISRELYRQWDDEVLPILGDRHSPQFCHSAKLEALSSLWLEVALDGKVLYDESRHLESELQFIRHKIAAGDYARKISYGHPYWVKRERDAK